MESSSRAATHGHALIKGSGYVRGQKNANELNRRDGDER